MGEILGFQIPKNEYTGKINTVKLGKDKSEILIGGEASLPFYGFEGELPNKPIIAMDVFDIKPSGWPESLAKYYSDVWDDPVKWSQKCISEFGAEAICLHLASTNPDAGNTSPEDAAELVNKVRESMGWVEEDSYKTLAAAAMGYNNNVIALNPLDVNIAKQLNILLTQLGLSSDRIAMDPSSSGVGYGIEYCFSAMERLKIAALIQNDKMTQMPIINNIASEVWKVKEVKESEKEYPEWGDLEERGINWETISVMCMLASGSNIITMRHPKAVSLIKEIIKELL